MNPASGPNPILLRYFAGEESLEAAAEEYVRICKEGLRASNEERQKLRDHAASSQREIRSGPELTEADLPKIRALMDLVEAKLDLINEAARKYLATAGNSALDKTARLLSADVRATLGEKHVPVVWSFAGDARELDMADPSSWLVENVQQYFQDTFVDTTWPACPRHPNHPLDHADGFWHCPRDRAAIARVGELSSRAGGT